MVKVKICGIRCLEEIEKANELNLDYIGFVFARSRRQVTVQQAQKLKHQLDTSIQVVGVFVNHTKADIIYCVEEKIIDVVQLHGEETEEDILYLKKNLPTTPIIKAINVTCVEDILKWQDSKVDFLLLDHGTGGTGLTFDWSVLEKAKFTKSYFIAGGLNSENVGEALRYKPYAVDVSGGVETDGTKDLKKMDLFTKRARKEVI
ncbi:MAG: phosphoribosylanthranilate isomerase [Eubacteriales bacterium]